MRSKDLKDVVGSLIAGRKMEEFSQLAEKYRAQRLKELYCVFILENIKTLPKELLVKLCKEMTSTLPARSWEAIWRTRFRRE